MIIRRASGSLVALMEANGYIEDFAFNAMDGRTRFTQGAPELRAAFAGNSVNDRLVLADRGETVTA